FATACCRRTCPKSRCRVPPAGCRSRSSSSSRSSRRAPPRRCARSSRAACASTASASPIATCASLPARRSPCRSASASSLACALPSDHRDWNALAWTYLQSGQSELALEAARRAHEGNRNNLDYLNTLGVAYGEMGELARAESSFRKALKRRPVFLDALVNLAKTLEKQERLDESIPLYERALALDETYPKLAANLARLYRQRGDALRARQLLERLAKHVDGQDLAMALAECDYELGSASDAVERLSHAVDQHPEWLLARNALAHALLASG